MPSYFHGWSHATLRVLAGLLFLQHGLQKLFGYFGGMDGHGATAALNSLMGAAGLFESVGGILLIAGLLTTPVAAVLLFEMLYAYVTVHAPQGGLPIQNQGELPLLFGSIFFFLFGSGAGPFSVDSWLATQAQRERRGPIFDRRVHAAT